MRIFNNSLLILLAMVFAYTAGQLVFGGTITRPYGPPDYAGGQKAVGTKVNAEFQSIVDWLNGGNLDSTNISVNAITTTLLRDNAVTLSKIAGPCCGYPTVTSSSSAYTMSTVTPATVTNLTTTFTSHGRSLYVGLEPSTFPYVLNLNQTYGSYVKPSGTAGDAAALFFVRDGSTTVHFNLPTSVTGANQPVYPCSSFHYTEDAAGAGTFVFAVKVSVASGADTMSVVNCRLVVREML